MELTKEHFDKQLSKLATSEELTALSAKIDKLQDTVNSHTTTLDSVAKQTKDWNTEIIAVRARLDRHDEWFKAISEKLNLKLES